MTLLSDSEIFEKIGSDQFICEGFRKQDKSCWTTKDSAIQASSLDLHIGQIYIPNEEGKPKYQHCLKPGQTVVIRTREILDFPNDVAAIGFPPSTMSSKGILTTNPGHIDPGYRGVFHITLINMGKNDYPLKKDDLIVTLLLFKLAKDKVTKGYMQRRSSLCDENNSCPCDKKDDCTDKHAKTDDITETMLDYLAPDFMNFEFRAKKIAKEEVKDAETSIKNAELDLKRADSKLKYTQVVAGLLITILSLTFGYLQRETIARISSFERINAETRLQKLEKNIEEYRYIDKIREIEKKLIDLDKRIEVAFQNKSELENNNKAKE